MRNSIIRSVAICFLACFLTGIPFHALTYRIVSYTQQLNEVISIVNTNFGIDDWTVTPPYKSSDGDYNLGTIEYQGDVIDLWEFFANNIYIDLDTNYGTNHYGYESYKVVCLYPFIYYVGKDGVGYDECIRVTLEGTYRSGFLGIFGARVGTSDVYIHFMSGDCYIPNVSTDALAKFPDWVTPVMIEESVEWGYTAREEKTESIIDYLRSKFD